KWLSIVSLVGFQIILRWILQEIGDYEEDHIRTFRLSPREKVLQFLCRNTSLVVLAVNKPLFLPTSFVHVYSRKMSDDVSTAIGWAALLAGPFAPIEIDEAKFFEQVKAELFKFSCGHPTERQFLLGFHIWDCAAQNCWTASNFSAIIPAMKPATVLLLLFGFFFSAVAQQAKEDDPVLFFSVDRTGFSATGKWIPSDAGEKPAFPSETQIDCFRRSMECVEGTADFYMGFPHVTLNYLQVVKWDNDALIASSSAACMTNTILVAFAEKTLTATDSMKRLPEKQKSACKFFGAEKTMHYAFVLMNSERWNKEREQKWLHPDSQQ